MSVAETPAPSDLYITLEMHRRVPKVADYLSENLALHDIAAQMLDHPDQVLPKLVERAMLVTEAVSAGISAFESKEGTPGIFRWRNLHGELAPFEGATTPREHSPCGVCLDRFEPTLTRHPERFYGWIAEAGIVCPEVLLVPLYMARGQPLGTLWIVSENEGHFDSSHARILRELASFAGIALAMLHDQRIQKEAIEQYEMLAAEMSHRIKNLFSIVGAMISISKRSAVSADDLATTLSGRLQALATAHSFVRDSFAVGHVRKPTTTGLRELIETILLPYEGRGNGPRYAITGEEVALGGQAATNLALVFHELATNAAKYGALALDQGKVLVSWERLGDTLILQWQEHDGPPISAKPEHHGFGTKLADHTITRQLSGIFALQWHAQGLVAELELPWAKLAF